MLDVCSDNWLYVTACAFHVGNGRILSCRRKLGLGFLISTYLHVMRTLCFIYFTVGANHWSERYLHISQIANFVA